MKTEWSLSFDEDKALRSSRAGWNFPWSEADFHRRMRQVGEQRYYDKHPFHLLLEEGKLDRAALGCWIRNRFYYQRNIPVKDALIPGCCPAGGAQGLAAPDQRP